MTQKLIVWSCRIEGKTEPKLLQWGELEEWLADKYIESQRPLHIMELKTVAI